MKRVNVQIKDQYTQEALLTISQAVTSQGGKALLVGGCVRDTLSGVTPRDFDVEVYGIAPTTLIDLLSSQFQVSVVGEAFGVLKIHGLPIDVSVPRRESKIGRGHRGFEIIADVGMTLEEAASRRDFTINAMAIDLITHEFLDPFGGFKDLENHILQHTSPKFCEDPLRVLRGQQFAGRFGLTAATETIQMAKGLFKEYETLPIERIWAEWYKWAAQSTKPSFGLVWLQETDWLQAYPELVALEGCPQDPRWHPEGDVWTHTLHVTDEAAQIGERDVLAMEDRATLVLAALCHDLGKPATTEITDQGIVSRKHSQTKETYQQFLQRIGAPLKIVDRVVALCLNHLTHLDFVGSSRHVRRLALALSSCGETIEMLSRLVEADNSGRPPLPKNLPEKMNQMSVMATELEIKKSGPQPILLGRHLLNLGMKPGPHMGEILKAAFEAQLDGQFETLKESKEWLSREGLLPTDQK